MPPDASGTLSSHAADIAAVIRYISKAPVLVGHSFGGLIAQRYAINAATGESGYPAVRALAFLASSSPEGVDYGRFIKRAPVMTAKVTWALISKNYLNNTEALRDVFFCEASEPSELQHLQSLFNAHCPESRLVDLRRLRMDELPLPRIPEGKAPPTLVLGAVNDTIVDAEDCELLASYYGTRPKMLGPSGHDAMLDIVWERFAKELLEFVESVSKSQ